MLATLASPPPVRLAPINVFQVGGGLANAGRRETIQRLQVLLDGRVIQDKAFDAPVNIADVAGGLPGILPGKHVLTLKIPRQTEPSALYQSFLLSVIVGNTAGRVLCHETFPDQYGLLRPGETMEFAFAF